MQFVQIWLSPRERPQLGQRRGVFHLMARFWRLILSMNSPANSEEAITSVSCGGTWFIHPSIGRSRENFNTPFGERPDRV